MVVNKFDKKEVYINDKKYINQGSYDFRFNASGKVMGVEKPDRYEKSKGINRNLHEKNSEKSLLDAFSDVSKKNKNEKIQSRTYIVTTEFFFSLSDKMYSTSY